MPYNSKLQTTREPATIYFIRYRDRWRPASDLEVAEAESGDGADVYRWTGELTDLLDSGSLRLVKEADPWAHVELGDILR